MPRPASRAASAWWALAGLTVLAQIAYPLVHHGAQARVTVLIVALFAATMLVHAWLTRGIRSGVLALVAAAVVGWAVEIIGVHTGVPFGRYSYGTGLGPQVAGVPVLVGAAWAMFAWPAALVARRLVASFAGRVVVGGWALASWDLFLDPQMVAAGRWRWRFPSPHLPGVPQVPLTNLAGWLAASMLISLLMQAVLTRDARPAPDGLAVAMFLWTWLSATLALAAFLDLAGAAVWGFVAMGLVAVPLIITLLPHRPVADWAR